MQFIVKDADNALVRFADALQYNYKNWQCLHFHFSKLNSSNVENGRIDMVAKTIVDQFKDHDGQAFLCPNNDIFVVGEWLNPDDVTKTINNLRYTLANDELIHKTDRGGRFLFYTQYFLRDTWPDFYSLCTGRVKKEKKIIEKKVQRVKLEESDSGNKLVIIDGVIDVFNEIIAERTLRNDIKVLVVEDQYFSRELLRSVISKKFKAFNAATARDALDLYLEHAPDIVFMDIGLPDVDGHSLMGKILDIDPDAFVIVVSADSHPDAVKRALSKAKGFVVKPFNKEKLNHYVDLYFKEHEDKRELI